MAVYSVCFGAFFLYFLNDWNDWKLARPALRLCFPVGSVLLCLATVWAAWHARPVLPIFLRVTAGCGILLFLWLLADALFFALPAKDAYAHTGQRRPACTCGMYALCRHPGVLWFAGLYLCLSGTFGLSLRFSLLAICCNLALVVFEDCFVFPAKLEGYAAYRHATPFLLPTPHSIRTFCADRKNKRNLNDAF